MGFSQWAVLAIYVLGLLLFLAMAVYFLIRARQHGEYDEKGEHDSQELFEDPNQILTNETIFLQEASNRLSITRSLVLKSSVISREREPEIPEIAMDVNVAVIEAARGRERALSKSQATELLFLLRDELAIPPKDASPTELIQSIRGRLISLTEMMAEAQVGLCDLTHRVVDIKTITDQIPAIVRNHRRHITSLHRSIEELKEKAATRSDVQQIEKELAVIKWAFTVVLGIILAVLGALLGKLI